MKPPQVMAWEHTGTAVRNTTRLRCHFHPDRRKHRDQRRRGTGIELRPLRGDVDGAAAHHRAAAWMLRRIVLLVTGMASSGDRHLGAGAENGT